MGRRVLSLPLTGRPPSGRNLDEKPPPYRRPELPWERKADPNLGWGRWASAGIEFGLAVVLFFLGGQALDATFGTAPWWTLVGSLVGVAAGMYLLLRTVIRGQFPPSKDDHDSRPPGPQGPGSA